MISRFLEKAGNGNIKEVSTWLTWGMPIDTEGFDGSTALIFAEDGSSTKIVRRFLKSGADVNKQNNKNWTSLHFAAAAGSTDVIKELLKQSASTNIKDNEGCTPIDREYKCKSKNAALLLERH